MSNDAAPAEVDKPVEPEPALVLQIHGDIGENLHRHERVLILLTAAPFYLLAMQIIRFATYSHPSAVHAARGNALGFSRCSSSWPWPTLP